MIKSLVHQTNTKCINMLNYKQEHSLTAVKLSSVVQLSVSTKSIDSTYLVWYQSQPMTATVDCCSQTQTTTTEHCTDVQYELYQQTGVYKFNWINFQETPGGISRKIQDMFAFIRPAMLCTKSTTFNGACDDELQPTLIVWYAFYTTWGSSKDKIWRPVST